MNNIRGIATHRTHQGNRIGVLSTKIPALQWASMSLEKPSVCQQREKCSPGDVHTGEEP